MNPKEESYSYVIRSRKPRYGEAPRTLYYTIVKFENSFLLPTRDVYTVRVYGNTLNCDCPAGRRPSCKHRDMIKIFQDRDAINKMMFYTYETGEWYDLSKDYKEYGEK